MNVLAFAASNSRHSINGQLIQFALQRLTTSIMPGAATRVLDLNDFEMPIYSIDREQADGIHPLAQEFFDAIGEADAIVVSFAEHNGSFTAAWKNIFDWMSRIDSKVWQGKPMVALAATPGKRGGAGVLGTVERLAPFFGSTLAGKYGVANWATAWDPASQSLKSDADLAGLDSALAGLRDH
ncbi:MAG: NAD(P)H-dependent oxidoreductase [Pseudomonadota bacterium]